MIASTNELFQALVYSVGFIVFLAGLEVLCRKFNIHSLITRRIAHVGAGIFGLVVWSVFSATTFIIINLLFISVISLSQWLNVFKSVHNVNRKTYGEIYLPIGILATYILASNEPHVFIPAILIMTFSDAIAGILSDIRDKGRPSKVGSLGFFITSLLILGSFNIPAMHALSLAFILTVVEEVSPYGTDNATVPIAATVLLLSL